MKAQILALDGSVAGEIQLKEEIFGLPERKDILHTVVRWQLDKRRAGTHKTKTVSEISGTTRKPHKQKGTGHARQGSRRSPQFKGGAVIFGPVVRSHATDLPKKVRKLGLKTALSVKFAQGNLRVISRLDADKANTKEFAQRLKQLGLTSALIVDEVVAENVAKSLRNIKHVDVLPQIGLNVYDILRHQDLVLTQGAIAKLEERLS
jgi:large subunit ribosomal protein L4